MSKQSLPDRFTRVKPEPPPHPILAMLRTLEQSCTDRDRLTRARLLRLCRVLDGREAGNAA